MSENITERLNREAAERRDRGERPPTPASAARQWLLSAKTAFDAGDFDAATAAAAIAMVTLQLH